MACKRKFEDLASDDPNNNNNVVVRSPPTWEIVNLVTHHLDPKSLAIGCCVSKSWDLVMSSDSVWKPIYAADYPSLSTSLGVTGDVHPPVPFRHLYAMAYISAKRQRRLPLKPTLSLNDLLFVVTLVFESAGRPVTVHVVKRGDEIMHDPDGVFMLDIGCPDLPVNFGTAHEDVKVTRNLVLKGWKAVLTMMDFEGHVKFSGSEVYLSEKLPSPGCCSSDLTSGLIVADLKIRTNKIIVGMLSTISWRYLSVDDGLRYLQHFLLPRPKV